MSETIEVADDIPAPPRSGGRLATYPFDTIQPGQSFAFFAKTSENVARSLASRAGKRLDRKFRVARTPSGLRCWRIE